MFTHQSKIEELLKLHGLKTAELIHQNNQDRLKEQKEMEEIIYGLITVKICFLNNWVIGSKVQTQDDICFDFIGDFIGKLSTFECKLQFKSKQRLKEGKKSM